MADPVPREPLVGVRGVLPPGDPFGPEEVPELLAPEGEERPDDAVGPPGADAAPGPAEPPLEVEEDRLGLVLQGVPGGEERPGAEVAPERQERLVPEAPGRGFQALPGVAQVADGEAPEDEGEAERGGEVGRGAGVPVALGSAQLVVDVEADERDAPRASPPGRGGRGGRWSRPRPSRRRRGPSPRPGGRKPRGGGRRRRAGDQAPEHRGRRRRHPRMVGETGRAGRFGGDGRTRTADTGLMRPPLYRLSYIATSRPQSGEWYQTREL